MTKSSSLKKPVKSYIINIQILLILIVVFLVAQFHWQDNYVFHTPCILLATLILILIFLTLRYKNKKSLVLDLLIILIDIAIITAIILITSSAHLEILFLILIMIVAVEFPPIFTLFFPLLLGLYNGVIKYFILQSPYTYTIEEDMIIIGLFSIVSWLVSSVFNAEKKTRMNLETTRENLMENKALLEDIILFMPLGLVVVNREEKIVHINQAALEINEITGKKPVDYLGGPFIDYFNQRGETVPFQQSLILKILHKEQSFYKEKRIDNGKILEYSGKGIYDEEGDLIYAILVFQDVSQEERNRERISQLERINLISQMATSIAHELKKPLTTIKGYLHLAKKEKEYLNQENLKILLQEIDNCNTTIANFLSVVRKTENKKEILNLQAIISELSILIGQDALFNGINYKQEIEEIPDLFLNKNEIRQLLLNLCRNGIEAMEDGGTLTLRLKSEEDAVILEVEDTGTGMSEEFLENVGMPFFTTKELGTGLGLSVCTSIIKNHNGESTITSKVGQGTKVTISFPLIIQQNQA